MALFNDIQSLPSQFPEDLKVLAVDHDTDFLNVVVEMSIPCNYQGLLINLSYILCLIAN